MKELTYNILRKMIESPLEVEYRNSSFLDLSGTLYIKGNFILSISHMKHANALMNFSHSLSDKDLRRILSCVEHCEAMKVRHL